jgi:hypothetical protein
MSEAMFPILSTYEIGRKSVEVSKSGGYAVVIALPWAMMTPHENQAQANHGQSLRRLAERGGLGWCEAVAVLENRPWKQMSNGAANARLLELLSAWEGSKALAAARTAGRVEGLQEAEQLWINHSDDGFVRELNRCVAALRAEADRIEKGGE